LELKKLRRGWEIWMYLIRRKKEELSSVIMRGNEGVERNYTKNMWNLVSLIGVYTSGRGRYTDNWHKIGIYVSNY
jgi:hypothetical protein